MRYMVRSSIVTAISAATFLALAVASASAGHFRFSEQRFDAKWGSLVVEAGSNLIACPVTLEGSFHSATFAKIEGALIGHITRASVSSSSCLGGSATILGTTLPWPIQYAGFGGILPSISNITFKMIKLSLQIQPTGSVVCLMETTAEHPARFIMEFSGGAATSITAEEWAGIPLRGSLGLCAFGGEAHLSGITSSVLTLRNITRITLTLI